MQQSALTLYEKGQKRRIETYYSHKNSIQGKHYHLNCYGFVLHLIHQVNKALFLDLIQAMHALKKEVPLSYDGLPCPANLKAIFNRVPSTYWRKVPLKLATKGDIVVYTPKNYQLPPPEKKDLKRHGSHTMVVLEVLGKQEGCFKMKVIEFTSRIKKEAGLKQSVVYLTKNSVRWTRKTYQKEVVVARLF